MGILTGTNVQWRALEGSRVHLTADTDPPAFHQSIHVLSVRGLEYEFNAGPRFAAAELAETFLQAPLTTSRPMKGGLLRTGSSILVSNHDEFFLTDLPTWAAWEGESHSVATHTYGASDNRLVDVFESIELQEFDDGLTLRPAESWVLATERPPSVLADFPELGLVSIEPVTRTQARNTPAWEGTVVRGGELFVADANRPGEHYILLAKSCVAKLFPHPSESRDRQVDAFASFVCEWST